MFRSIVLCALALAPVFGGSIGGGSEACTGSSVTALSYTWQVCGNVTGGGDLTVDSTTGSVSINPLSNFAGTGFPFSYQGITGTDGSAAWLSFDAPNGGTLSFSLSGRGNAVYYAVVLLDGQVVADAYSPTTDVTVYEDARFTVPVGAGSTHTLVVAMVNGFQVQTLADPFITMNSLDITLNSGNAVPEPATLLMAAPLIGFVLLWRRKRTA